MVMSLNFVHKENKIKTEEQKQIKYVNENI